MDCTMQRPIDAYNLIEKYGDWYTEEGTEEGFIGTIKDLVKAEPTLSPDEVRGVGEWIGDGDGYADGLMVYDMWSCSCCGEYFDEWDDRPTWKYCPNCGARMKGVSEDAENT